MFWMSKQSFLDCFTSCFLLLTYIGIQPGLLWIEVIHHIIFGFIWPFAVSFRIWFTGMLILAKVRVPGYDVFELFCGAKKFLILSSLNLFNRSAHWTLSRLMCPAYRNTDDLTFCVSNCLWIHHMPNLLFIKDLLYFASTIAPEYIICQRYCLWLTWLEICLPEMRTSLLSSISFVLLFSPHNHRIWFHDKHS